ncbi:MAG: DUF1961 family protein [Gloeobacteraceae cyanobacterium ES-bin-144]|nr:DUF1961 family protein [Verrucomicrobiales bacterium]
MEKQTSSYIDRRTILGSGIAAAFAMTLGSHFSASAAENPIQPKFRYLSDASALTAGEEIKGPARILDFKGRKGINPTSIHTSIKLGAHNLNGPRGTVALWFFPLEDLACSFTTDNMAIDNPHFANYAFLSDCPTPRDYGQANFNFQWSRNNELRAKFFRGNVFWKGFEPGKQKAWVQAVPFNYFKQHQWYQLAFTWDAPAKTMSLYANGILLGKSDQFNRDFIREVAADTLYAGCPALCHGTVELYDEVLSPAQLHAKYRAEATDFSPEIERELRKVFEGTDLADFTFKPDANWTKQLDLDLKDPEHVKSFYIQGHAEAVKAGGHPEGLLISTPDEEFNEHNTGKQVYIWSHQNFEGNLYVEYEWKSLKPNGLSLLMVHASGMTREDFMADYPKKTSGQMHTVHGENVRNYHWEYYREMNDVRNDVGTAFSRKNPFIFRNGFGSSPAPFAQNEWHKLQMLVVNGKVTGAIDGKVLLEFTDTSHTNTGAILNYGHISIRCMIHTSMVFRNLKVYTEKLPFIEVPIKK